MKRLMICMGLVLGMATLGAGCGKKGAGKVDIDKACNSLVRGSTKDKAKFIAACKKVDPKVVGCVAKARKGEGSKGDSCDKLRDETRGKKGDVWMKLMMGELGQ